MALYRLYESLLGTLYMTQNPNTKSTNFTQLYKTLQRIPHFL